MPRPTPEPERLDAVLSSLADPRRRDLIARLSRAPASASALAREMPVSRQAVAKHLDALSRAGLVEAVPVGREVRYRLRPAPLAEVGAWATRVGAEWEERLERLDAAD